MSTCSTYSESASGCFFISTIRPTLMSSLPTSTGPSAEGAAPGNNESFLHLTTYT
ncbi:unnamed protein product [Nesidiocoris tenuis]|uniref:Uncharacterized protein n=1 Tax=Nesidiocoris tenuis TaxID=355587 RepID=A0A6H5FWJ7_9HEMI|nr:unnamed protein product [Nesidiocoris tenuis]